MWVLVVVERDDAVSLIADLPGSIAAVLASATGEERHSDLSWSVGEYVCQVGDNLRIWAERPAGASSGSGGVVGPYDENLPATAGAYEKIPLAAST
jgi:hypothetical protein